MPTHPNRSKNSPKPGSTPKPFMLKQARTALAMTVRECAEIIYCTESAWTEWEAGTRRMHPAYWELFKIKTGPRVGLPPASSASHDLRASVSKAIRLRRQ